MKCSKCGERFTEQDLEESHDVPCYLFFIEAFDRKNRKFFADKYTRRYLCKPCHNEYELMLRNIFIKEALSFSKSYFGESE